MTGGLDAIAAKIERGGYNGTYHVTADVKRLLTRVRDGHLNWANQCLEGAMGWRHNMSLVHLWDEDGNSGIYAASKWCSHFIGDFCELMKY